jgi:hypothetical protein
MKIRIVILSLLFLLPTLELLYALTFPELLGKIEEEKARRAISVLNEEKNLGDFHVDRYERHFLMNENDKIAHIIYILSNEKDIDGELSFCVTRMFAYSDLKEGIYDAELAEKRFKKIKGTPLVRIKNFLRYVGGDLEIFKNNLNQFENSLKIK